MKIGVDPLFSTRYFFINLLWAKGQKGNDSKQLLAKRIAKCVINHSFKTKCANLNVKSYINVKYFLPYKESML